MFFSKVFPSLGADLGMDLGTSNTRVCVSGRGIVLSEPSVIAVRKGTKDVLCDGSAVGMIAKEMIGRTPLSIDAIRPLRDGVVSDFEMTQALLTYFLRKVHERRRLFSPRLLLAVPAGINAIEKRALFNAAERAGTRKVYLLDEPRAAGLGAGIPIHEARAHMIVDIGGGTTDITIISLADTVVSTSIKIAGDAMDEAIVKHIHRNYNNIVGLGTAEAIKIALGSVAPVVEDASMTVSGRDLIAGLPRGVTVTAEDVRDALLEPVGAILDAIRDVLERAGPELAGDLFQNGMTLCGGGVLLGGFPELLAAQTGLPVRVARDPLSAVARGTAIFLECLEDFKHILETGDEDL